MGKRTLVMGASEDPSRYAYLAVLRLKEKGHEVIPLGLKEGMIDGIKIVTEVKGLKDIDTVTLYLNHWNQKAYYDFLLKLHPKRIIFNPGAENRELKELAQKKGIQTVEGCTLVMLSASTY